MSASLKPFWLKITLERDFLIFCFFFRNFLARVEYEWNSELKFCFLFFDLPHPVLDKIMPGRGFIICWIFYYFFRNFLARVEFQQRSGLKFCFLFFGLSHPVFAKINAGNKFYKFLNFFTIFFGIFLLGLSMNRIRD